jgi:Tol biopolymer transport system component
MKKYQMILLFLFLVGCAPSPNVFPVVTPSIEQMPSLIQTQTVIPPTETPVPTSTFTPPPTSTATGGGGGKIAFTSEREGYAEIYIMNPNGSEQIALANGITPKYNPAWSPDGTKIAFAANDDNSASLYIMNADGSNPTKLIDAKDLSMNRQAPPDWQLGIGGPVWSPDGKKIAFGASHTIGGTLSIFDMYVIDADGSNLVTPAARAAFDGGPAWSPDSQKIAFGSGVEWDKVGVILNSCGGIGGICVMNADGTNLISIANGTGYGGIDGAPNWSPDSTKIAFSSGRNGDREIFVMNSDGSNTINLTNYGAAWDDGPIWSPDGEKIAFNSYRDGNFEIYVMNADGTDVINVTNNLTDEGGPAWSPDSTKIAFISERDGNSEIYVINADGSNLVRLTDNDANDYSPVWSP